MIASTSLLIGCLCAAAHATIKDDDRLGLDVRRHQPCPAEANWSPAIVLADDKAAPLTPDPWRPGCYSLTGDLKVNRKVNSNLQVFVELRTDASTTKRPQPCNGADSNGCGGYGSCVYCGDCSSMQSKDAKIADVTLRQNGKTISCENTKLEPGVHENVELSFCMPKFKQFLDAFELDRQTFDNLLGNTDKQSLYMWVYVFDASDTNVARLARIDAYQQKSLEDRQYQRDVADWRSEVRQAQLSGRPVPSMPIRRPYQLSESEYARTNVQKAVQGKDYVACHRIMATLYYDQDNALQASRTRRWHN